MGVITLSLVEAVLWYSEYVRFNEEGTKPLTLLVAAIIVGPSPPLPWPTPPRPYP